MYYQPSGAVAKQNFGLASMWGAALRAIAGFAHCVCEFVTEDVYDVDLRNSSVEYP